jgi:hypothetical protein
VYVKTLNIDKFDQYLIQYEYRQKGKEGSELVKLVTFKHIMRKLKSQLNYKVKKTGSANLKLKPKHSSMVKSHIQKYCMTLLLASKIKLHRWN